MCRCAGSRAGSASTTRQPRAWRAGENFARVTFTGIDAGADRPAPGDAPSSVVWRPFADLACADRLSVMALPEAYRVLTFAARYHGTRRRLAEAVRANRYLCSTLGSLAGDWGGVAALEAIRQNRPYAVWFDRVEHEVIRRTSSAAPLRRHLKNALILPLMVRYHHHLTARSGLGLFQGRDTFDAYAPMLAARSASTTPTPHGRTSSRRP